jgi:ribosomal-protein-alanine N-acetyltransferase
MSLTDPNGATNGVRFRDYEARDFPRLCELDRLCFPLEIAYAPEEIAAALAHPRTFAVVAESPTATEDSVIGFVLASRDRASLGHIITIDIHADFRRRGIGERLMEMGEQRLASVGARRVVLEVAIDNEPAIAFYQARGYANRRTLPRYYRDGSDAYLMEKLL